MAEYRPTAEQCATAAVMDANADLARMQTVSLPTSKRLLSLTQGLLAELEAAKIALKETLAHHQAENPHAWHACQVCRRGRAALGLPLEERERGAA